MCGTFSETSYPCQHLFVLKFSTDTGERAREGVGGGKRVLGGAVNGGVSGRVEVNRCDEVRACERELCNGLPGRLLTLFLIFEALRKKTLCLITFTWSFFILSGPCKLSNIPLAQVTTRLDKKRKKKLKSVHI